MVRVDTQYIERYRYILEKNIHLINPCMRMTLEQWIVDYEYVITDLHPLISPIHRYIDVYFSGRFACLTRKVSPRIRIVGI